MRRLAILIVAVSGFAASPVAANPMLEHGIKLLTELESAKAVKQLRRALRWRGSSPAELATIHLYLGIAHFNLQQTREAAASFRRALALRPEIQLPRLTSPKIEELFRSLRPAVPAPAPPPPSRPAAPGPVRAPPPPRSAPPEDAIVARSSPTRVAAWTTGGVAAATGVAAVALASLTAVENSRAGDLGLTSREAMAHHDAATSRALGANVCFALAGAAAVTAGVLFYLSWRRAREARAGRTPRVVSAERIGVLSW
jgi:tetratricopeptide (TPR) repeat protein